MKEHSALTAVRSVVEERDALAKQLHEQSEWVGQLAKRAHDLAEFVQNFADEDCIYGEGEPEACANNRKHGQCLPCKAKELLS